MELPEFHIFQRNAGNRAAMPMPSPVLMKALVEAAQIRPAPPIAILDRWTALIMDSCIESMKKAGKTVRNRRELLLNPD